MASFTAKNAAQLRAKAGTKAETLAAEFASVDAAIDALHTTVQNSNLSATHKITRSATIVIAASDSSAKSKAQADYVCDGTADNVEIQAALDALPNTGGEIHLLDGTYQLAATVARAIDNVTWSGCGFSTYLSYNGSAKIISAGIQSGWYFKDFRMDNGAVGIQTATNWIIKNVWRDTFLIDDLKHQYLGNAVESNLLDEFYSHPLVVEFDDFESDRWTSENSTVSYDTSKKFCGTRSLKLDIPAAGTGSIEFVGSLPDLTDCIFSLMMNTVDYSKLTNIHLRINTGAGNYTDYAYTESVPPMSVNDRWMQYVLANCYNNVGTPILSNSTKIKIVFNVSGATTVYIDKLCFHKRFALAPRGVVTFTVDDGFESVYTKVVPTLSKYNYAGVAAITTFPLTQDRLTGFRFAQQNGWDIINHSYGHNDVNNLADPILEHLPVQKYLADNGFRRGAGYLAMAYGSYSDAIHDAIYNNHALIRGVSNQQNSIPITGSVMGVKYVMAETALAAVTGWIDGAISRGHWLQLMLHDIVDSDPTGYQVLSSTLFDIVEYCHSSGIEVLTYSQVVDRIRSTAQHLELSGTGTIANGTSSVNIRHGFHKAPSSIQITPTSSLGSAASLWVSSKDTGTGNLFTVSVNDDPGADVTFEWVAVL